MSNRNRNALILIATSVFLWAGCVLMGISASLQLKDLPTYSGIISSANVERGGRSYFVLLGLERDTRKFHVGVFGTRFFAEQLAEKLKLGDKATIHYTNARFSSASTNARVYQVENAGEIVYYFDDAIQQDKTAAFALGGMALFITVVWGYIFLRTQAKKLTA